ncbi:MAG: Mrp/NBP35 family ATP-binding protein [Dehalococcoidia bacterium]|nr:Mrp/NBP35 family ATP-binding protein [Dehalococcoidia bacterium]MDH4292442.1 Mrp/NBP35 family ATP-binding protein [Dehalococcoidia bacterium]
MANHIEAKLQNALDKVFVPGIMRSLVQMNLVRSAEIREGKARVTLASTAVPTEYHNLLKDQAATAVSNLSGVKEVAVDLTEVKPKELNHIAKIIAIMSGKGGVGKSLVASLLATSFAREGKEVGILDADITGPSIPKMFGLNGRPSGSETGILPILSKSGIEIMSMNLLLPSEDEAVIWRGPLMSKAITQFWEEVLWGKLDCLVIDLPPGTGDAPLTVLQAIPITGVIDVFTPQELTEMIVKKAVKMAQKMNVRVLGVVENMSYLVLPDTGKKLEVFGKSKGEEMAKACGAPLLGRLPIDPELAKLCDEGNIEKYSSDAVSQLFANVVAALNRET